MTALLVTSTPVAVLPARREATSAIVIVGPWSHVADETALPVASSAGRYEITRRGYAVMVGGVVALFGLMLATVTGSFLAVSDAPIAPRPAVVAAP